MSRFKTKGKHHTNRTEAEVVRSLDKLAAFEEFQAQIAPKLREMLKSNSASDILKFSEAYAAARLATVAMLESDPGKAIVAAKDILDRVQGKAKERTEHVHKFEKLKDEELDSIIFSKLLEDSGPKDN